MYFLMKKNYKRASYIVLAGFIVYLVSAISPLQEEINFIRLKNNISQNLAIEPGSFLNLFMISGFEGIAVDLLWLHMDEEWHKGRWYEMLPILVAITYIQPSFLQAWELGGWHLCYNMSVYDKDEARSKKFIDEGIKFLKKGIVKNPVGYELYFNLGWVYYHKLNRYEEAIDYFKSAVRFKHPSYIDRMIAHAYRKLGDEKSEMGHWKKCLELYPDDEYNKKIVNEFLNKKRK